jgi:hypothetical protein
LALGAVFTVSTTEYLSGLSWWMTVIVPSPLEFAIPGVSRSRGGYKADRKTKGEHNYGSSKESFQRILLKSFGSCGS